MTKNHMDSENHSGHMSFSISGDLFKGVLIRVFLLDYFNVSSFYDIFNIDGMGQKKNMKKNMRCGVWDEVVEQKGTLPPSQSSIGSKESAKKRI